MKILIAGGPSTGKSTLAKKLSEKYKNVPVRCTDGIIHQFSWSEASQEVATWFDQTTDFLIEGTIVVRALRKWLKQTPTIHTKPCDIVYWGAEPFVQLEPRQITLLMGCETIWNEIKNEVRARGVEIRTIERTA